MAPMDVRAEEAGSAAGGEKRYRAPREKKLKSGRTCRACGKDPYPNYFYCPSCHSKVCGYDEN